MTSWLYTEKASYVFTVCMEMIPHLMSLPTDPIVWYMPMSIQLD